MLFSKSLLFCATRPQMHVLFFDGLKVNQWWNNLSEGQKTVTGKYELLKHLEIQTCSWFTQPHLSLSASLHLTGIIAANALVFCCWRIPSLQRFMLKYFTSNPSSSECFSFVIC